MAGEVEYGCKVVLLRLVKLDVVCLTEELALQCLGTVAGVGLLQLYELSDGLY